MGKYSIRPLLHSLFPTIVFGLLIVVGGVISVATDTTRTQLIREAQRYLLSQTELIGVLLKSKPDEKSFRNIVSPMRDSLKESPIRISILAPDGHVVYDSKESDDFGQSENLAVQQAAHRGFSTGTHYSRHSQSTVIYAATRCDAVSGQFIVLASEPSTDVDHNLNVFIISLCKRAGLLLIVAAVLLLVVLRRALRPYDVLRDGIEHFSTGNLKHRIHIPPGDTEVGHMSQAMNSIASELDQRFQNLQNEQHEKETILTSLFDGILVIDCSECILNFNNVSATILGLSDDSKGKKIGEITRNSALTDLIRMSIRTKTTNTKEIIFKTLSDEFYQVDCIPLREAIGIKKLIVVFHNVTQNKRLQSQRRDVILQVSKHLKYPISRLQNTVINSLQDPAKEYEVSQDLRVVLGILNDMIYLTELEQASENHALHVEELRLSSLVKETLLILADASTKKHIAINVVGDCVISGNRNAIEQLFLRLLSNSITYSKVHGTIEIEFGELENCRFIIIRDAGIGIPMEAIPKLFNPFYRIDTPEHQQIKGGGLGLSIVKSVVDYHRGTLQVTSNFGSGATFEIRFPII